MEVMQVHRRHLHHHQPLPVLVMAVMAVTLLPSVGAGTLLAVQPSKANQLMSNKTKHQYKINDKHKDNQLSVRVM